MSETAVELMQVNISARAASRLAQGVLWIFSNEMTMKKPFPPSGAWCTFESNGKTLGLGYINPHSLIAGRVVSETVGDIESILRFRLEQAFAKRKSIFEGGSARLVFSESDFLPGLIVDAYGSVLVAQSSTAGIDAVLSIIESLLPACYEKVFGEDATAVVIRGDAGIRRLEGVEDFVRVPLGDESSLKEGTLTENGLIYAADFIEGQKTGFFLDQRDNRAFLESPEAGTAGATVLDLFCYSGGWGLRALKAGAEHATFVDQSAAALALAKRGLQLNQFSEGAARFVESDVFDYLEKASDRFQIVVCDPPAFVKSRQTLNQAKKAYEKLNRLAWRRVAPGGILITCSCSYHLGEADFMNLLAEAVAKESGRAHIIYRGFQAKDHAPLLAMPETAYLKCVGIRKG